jgi:hypothetical protein
MGDGKREIGGVLSGPTVFVCLVPLVLKAVSPFEPSPG